MIRSTKHPTPKSTFDHCPSPRDNGNGIRQGKGHGCRLLNQTGPVFFVQTATGLMEIGTSQLQSFLGFALRCLEKNIQKHILPKGALMMIYYWYKV